MNFIYEFEKAVAHEAGRRKLSGVICGHIHQAEIKSIEGISYYNCGDWVESCTALAERQDGHIEVLHWTSGEQAHQAGNRRVVSFPSRPRAA